MKQALKKKHFQKIFIYRCLTNATTNKFKNFEKVIYFVPKKFYKVNDYFEHRVPVETMQISIFDKNLFIPYRSRMSNRDYNILNKN